MYDPLFKFCIGIVVLLFSTQKLMKLAEKISLILRISPLIIGTTIVAVEHRFPNSSCLRSPLLGGISA